MDQMLRSIPGGLLQVLSAYDEAYSSNFQTISVGTV